MLHCLTLFLAPQPAPTQATSTLPPAAARPASWLPVGARSRWRFAVAVLGNTLGLAALLLGSWGFLLLLQDFLSTL
jgi:hypothetical protein